MSANARTSAALHLGFSVPTLTVGSIVLEGHLLKGAPLLLDNGLGRFVPDEGPGVYIVLVEVITDRFGDAGKGAAPDTLHRSLGEEALDEVEPLRAGRRQVEMEAWMLREPGLHHGRLVRSVVVEHEVDV